MSSYHVRNPYREALQEKQQRDLWNLDGTSDYELIPGGQKRVTNTNSKDRNDDVLVQEVASMPDPNQPVVIYSTRKPNYPIKYSCEHSLFYERKGADETIANFVDMLSHSEDTSNDVYSVSLKDIPVRLSLEFEIPIEKPDDYGEITSNVEALQWSLLNKISASTGLSKGCKIEKQYDENSLVTALTNINDMYSPTFADKHGTSNDAFVSRNSRYSNSKKNNRRRNREVNRNLLLSLPYPTSVYSIASSRPKWTASCTSEMAEAKDNASKCFTAEINYEVKYRGTTGESIMIQDYIQSIVHNQIALDPTQLFAEDITGLKWISNDEASDVFDPPDSEQGTQTPVYFGPDFFLEEESEGVDVNAISSATKEESNGFIASIVIPISTIVLIGLIWFCFHKYHKRKRRNTKGLQQTNTEDSDDAKGKKDIETGSDGTEKTPELQSKSSSDGTEGTPDLELKSSSESQGPPETRSCTEAMAKAMGMSPAASSALRGTSQSTPTRPKSCPVSVDSPERSLAGLPPRPLTVKRTVSTQLKKKRKKKKKKKKQVLAMTRVNSRDNIVEMPMISESESECDSEYTSGDEEYCDDGSSYDASSGCSTPSRSSASRSRPNSRNNSPQKSPREFPFPSSGSEEDPGYEFVMEAPEFSKDLFVEAGLKEVVGVDENMPPNLSLRPKASPKASPRMSPKIGLSPRMRSDPGDLKPSPAKASTPKNDASLAGSDRLALEIDSGMDLDSSFSEENGTVMERMLPLPWLANNKKSNKIKRLSN